jgi:hydroxyacylglutathione hydrolase
MKQIRKREFISGLCRGAVTFTPAFTLAGGLNADHNNNSEKALPKVTTTRHGGITVHCMVLGELAVNCYFIADSADNCVVIDPGAQSHVILDFIRQRKFRIKAWLLTHSHLDHISALDECYATIKAPVAMHPEENDWAFCDENQWEPHYPLTKKVPIERRLRHWQRFTDGGMCYTVLHTPGHSPGSVCYWFQQEKIIFSGDTLFARTVGRTDLHRSSSRALTRSLGVFLAMPPATVVYPGHGSDTTVRKELRNNPFLGSTDIFEEL